MFTQQVNPQIVVILIETSHPANIGSTARAMKTMGLTHLRLVEPNDFPSARAQWLASGANDVLDSATSYETFAAATADCQLVIGTSARMRGLPWPNIAPPEATKMALNYGLSGQKVALVFGREARGLTNEELRDCQVHTMIPSNPDYGVLNIAAAVQVICYELRMQAFYYDQALHDDVRASSDFTLLPRDQPLADQQALQGLMAHLQRSFTAVNFIQPHNHGKIWPRIMRLLQRSHLDLKEVALLRGLAHHLEVLMGKSKRD